MKKIITFSFSVALLMGAATYAYSLPIMPRSIEQGVYSRSAGNIGWAGQGYNSTPLLKLNKFSSSMFEGTSSFFPHRHVAGAGMSFIPEFSQKHGNDAGDIAPVPEPATIMLFGAGLIGLACMGRRRRMMKK